MSFGGPALRPVNPMPSLSGGYATGANSERPDLWRILSCAWAGFLGKPLNALPMVFGKNVRRGPVSAANAGTNYSVAGTGPARNGGSVWGNSRVQDSGSTQQINLGTTAVLFPDSKQATILVGSRKFTTGFTTAGLFGTNLDLGAFCPWSDENIYWDFGGSRVSSSSSGHTWQQDHVYAFSGGPLGQWIYIDGKIFTGTTTPPAPISSGTFALSNYQGNLTDDVILSFLYAFNAQLPTDEIARISCDPGMLFRPARPEALSLAGSLAATKAKFFFVH